MNILVPVAVAALVLGVAMRIYPRYIARVFMEDDAIVPPSERFADGHDFVKSSTHVVFGHFHHKMVMPAGDRMTVTVLPAWYESGEAMMIDPATGQFEFVVI